MGGSLTTDRVDEYARYVRALIAEIDDPSTSPRAALSAARAASEAMAKHALELHGGEPGKLMLEELISKLGQQKRLPPRLATALRTVQGFGNLGAHAQPDLVATTAAEVAPSRAALAIVIDWYEREIRGRPLDDAAAAPRRRSVLPLALGGVVLVGGVVAIVVATASPSSHRDARSTASTTTPPRQPQLQPQPQAAPRPVEAPPPPALSDVVVDLTVWRDGKGGPRALAPDAKLHTGDKVAFEARVSAPAYLYLLQRVDGEIDQLFPSELVDLANPLPADRSVRIPDGQRWFTLKDDGTYGPELITVIAAPAPLPDLEGALAGLAAQDGEVRRKAVARTRDAVAALDSTPSRHDGLVERGHLELLDDDTTSKVSIRFKQIPGDPLVVATFRYVHAR